MFRKFLFILFLLFISLIAGVTIFLMTFDLNDYKRLIEEKLSALLNRPVTVQSMEMKLAFIPTINIRDLQIGNPEGIKSEQPFFKINEMEAVLELVPLLSSNVNIHQVTIQSAEVHFVNKNGINNWTFVTANNAAKPVAKEEEGAKKKKESKLPKIRLDTINISQLLVSYQNDKQKHDIVLDNLVLKDFHKLSGNLTYDNKVVEIEINVGRLEDFIAQTSNFPIDIKARFDQATLHLNGKIGEVKDFSRLKMTAALNMQNVANVAQELGIKSKYIPAKPFSLNAVLEGNLNSLLIKQLQMSLAAQNSLNLTAKGKINDVLTSPNLALDCQMILNDEELTSLWKIQNFNSDFKLNASQKRIEIVQLKLESNRSDLTVNGSWLFQNPPKLDVILASNYLNISDFIRLEHAEKAGQGGATPRASQALMNDVFPWEMLNKMSASMQVNVKNLVVPDDIKGYVRVHGVGTLEKGHLKWPFEVDILDGTVKGMLSAEASKKNVLIQVQGRSLKLDNIRALAKDIQDVQLDMDVSLKTAGRAYPELLSQLNGQIVAELNNGYIINDWFVKLPEMLNLLQKQKAGITYSKPMARIPLICGAANLDVKGGIIRSKKQLAVETDTLNFVVDGDVNLNKQTVAVSMIPSVNQLSNKGNAALMTAQVVQIAGPFNNLTPTVDPGKAVQNLVQAGARALAGDKQTASRALCTEALKGYKLSKAKTTQKPKQQQPKVTPAAPKKETKKQFKQQLMDSLSQALQAGAQGAH